MAENRQVITPMLVYDDAPAAIEFLCRAFGFDEQSRFAMYTLSGWFCSKPWLGAGHSAARTSGSCRLTLLLGPTLS